MIENQVGEHGHSQSLWTVEHVKGDLRRMLSKEQIHIVIVFDRFQFKEIFGI